LHRDIKPSNIIVDAGNPTLIDFGASRAAIAGRTTNMTALFTPGYAAAEQFTSARQGPWTDIYGLAATLYNAITGKAPPSAVDRLLQDTYEPLSVLAPAGYSPGLLAGIDAGLAVRATDRPQSIGEWREILAQNVAPFSNLEMTHMVPPERRAPTLQPATAGTLQPPPAAVPRRPLALYAGIAATILVLLAGAWIVLASRGPAAVAVQDLSVAELEKVLGDRRKAETEATEKRRAEEEAQRRVETDAAAKRAADAELALAHERTRKAEEELARLKAEMETTRRQTAAATQPAQAEAAAKSAAEEEAQRQAEAEIAAARQAVEEAKRQAEAEAEAKRQSDEALAKAQAERQAADAEATRRTAAEAQAKSRADAEAVAKAQAQAERQKAEEEAAAKRLAENEVSDRKAAEAAENTLLLTTADRQRLQVALTSLGFATGGSDGAFGPRSRDAITRWQKSRNQPATGFLPAAQRDELLRGAAQAIARWDEEQKKIEEEKIKVVAAAPAVAASPAAAPAAATSPDGPTTSGFDGTYAGDQNLGGYSGSASRVTIALTVTKGRGSGTISSPGCSPSPFSVSISLTGIVSGEGYLSCIVGNGLTGPLKVSGRAKGRSIDLYFSGSRAGFRTTLSSGVAAPAPAAAASPDGLWRGTYACDSGAGSAGGQLPFTVDLNPQITNGVSSGGGFNGSSATGLTREIKVSVEGNSVIVRRYAGASAETAAGGLRLSGTFDGNTIRASGQENPTNSRTCSLVLNRAP
ncbi:MAG: peptidoglycan-binding protein, partial [Reyranella sp.]|nr:peptidoglycan-binding protein [Reyranella sp.]